MKFKKQSVYPSMTCADFCNPRRRRYTRRQRQTARSAAKEVLLSEQPPLMQKHQHKMNDELKAARIRSRSNMRIIAQRALTGFELDDDDDIVMTQRSEPAAAAAAPVLSPPTTAPDQATESALAVVRVSAPSVVVAVPLTADCAALAPESDECIGTLKRTFSCVDVLSYMAGDIDDPESDAGHTASPPTPPSDEDLDFPIIGFDTESDSDEEPGEIKEHKAAPAMDLWEQLACSELLIPRRELRARFGIIYTIADQWERLPVYQLSRSRSGLRQDFSKIYDLIDHHFHSLQSWSSKMWERFDWYSTQLARKLAKVWICFAMSHADHYPEVANTWRAAARAMWRPRMSTDDIYDALGPMLESGDRIRGDHPVLAEIMARDEYVLDVLRTRQGDRNQRDEHATRWLNEKGAQIDGAYFKMRDFVDALIRPNKWNRSTQDYFEQIRHMYAREISHKWKSFINRYSDLYPRQVTRSWLKFISTAESDRLLHISLISEQFGYISGTEHRLFAGGSRELSRVILKDRDFLKKLVLMGDECVQSIKEQDR